MLSVNNFFLTLTYQIFNILELFLCYCKNLNDALWRLMSIQVSYNGI